MTVEQSGTPDMYEANKAAVHDNMAAMGGTVWYPGEMLGRVEHDYNPKPKEPDVIDKATHGGPTLYLVVEGEYSDREVVAVFDEAHKDIAFDLARYSDGYVETHSCNAEADRLQQGLKPYHVEMWRNGDTSAVYTTGLAELRHGVELGAITKVEGARRTRCRRLYWHGWARDDAHAIRRANEVRIRMIAANQWEEDVEE